MWRWSGLRALAHRRRTRSAESSPLRVVRSMHAMARSSHAAASPSSRCARKWVAARRSTALVFTRTPSTIKLSGCAVSFEVRPFRTTGNGLNSMRLGWTRCY